MKILISAAVVSALTLSSVGAEDEYRATFGGGSSRNMVSPETGLPSEWDAESGKNIKWRAKVGSQTYAGPVFFDDRIFVGTNNASALRPEILGDKGVLMAFRAGDGELLWQATHDKLPAGRVNDWPQQGICSTPEVEGNRVYYVSNRAQMVALDLEGFADGRNDGFDGEQYRGELDADIIWSYDMIAELDVFPHNLAAGSPLIVGDLIYATTGQGVDEGHINIPSPLGPSFVAINKNTGELAWESALPGENILHGTWSNGAYGVAGGREQVVIPGGDGWVYSFEPKTGELIWKFDANPKESLWQLGGAGTRNNIISTPVFVEGKVYVGVGQDPEHGEGPGHFYAIDASQTGDVTESAALWHLGGENFKRTMSTAAIADGLIYIADLSGNLYCLDQDSGKVNWTYEAFAAIWGSPFVADGKVYLGDEDGEIAVLATGREMKVIAENNMFSPVYTTPIARDGVIYVASASELFAIEAE